MISSPLTIHLSEPPNSPPSRPPATPSAAGPERPGSRIRARVATVRQIAGDLLREIEDRHALQPDMAGAGERREEQALAAEQDLRNPRTI